MQHTVAAVFDDYVEAQHAMDELLGSGFSNENVHLSQNTEASGTATAGDHETHGGISGFFRHLFGEDDDTNDAALYSEAVRQGNYVLTVDAPDDDLVDRATEVIDRHHPVDIDEQASQWRSGAWSLQSSMKQPDTMAENEQEKTIPVIQEELKVGKRQVQRGSVRVYQRVTETPVHESVQLREERVKVERRPVDQPASEADISALGDDEFEVREMGEEPVIAKTARVVEEVVVKKDVSERQQDIDDTVRRTDVEVEQSSGQTAPRPGAAIKSGSNDFRSHWTANFAPGGGTYEDYEPAYLYGTGLGSNKRYQGMNWGDIEPDVRTGWEAQNRNSGSTWDRMKGAVRHGWEKVRR